VEYYSKEFCSNERTKLSKYVFLVEFVAVNGVAMMLNTVLTIFIIDVPIFS
jgi:hypothetical protein